jgi:ABC-2 type transport system permease protein
VASSNSTPMPVLRPRAGTRSAPRAPRFWALVGVEWFKLYRRPMPYVLLVVLVAFVTTNQLLAYLILRVASATGGSLSPEERRQFLDALALPAALPGVFANAQNLGSIMLIILAAVSFGGEFGWGTLRLLLGRGVGRAQHVASKLVALAGWTALLVLGGVASGLVGAALITLFEGRHLGGALAGLPFAELPAMAARTYYTLLVYLLLTAFVTVATRSTAAGLATALVYYFLERLVLTGRILGLFTAGWLARALHLVIGVNVQVLMDANGSRPDAAPPPGGQSPGQAALTLACYAAGFLLATLILFQRRDVTAGVGQ